MLGILQTILAARNDRQDGRWTQLLVILAIAVVYGVKALIKAKKSFTNEPDEPEEPEEPPILRQRRQAPEWVKPEFTMVQQQQPTPEPVKAEITSKAQPLKRRSLTLQEAEQPEQLQPDIVSELELNLDDTDSLRRAIIYSEILGKPVSLRQGG